MQNKRSTNISTEQATKTLVLEEAVGKHALKRALCLEPLRNLPYKYYVLYGTDLREITPA
jgi:hypothetical protein